MSTNFEEKTVVGRTAKISIPTEGPAIIMAKIDTGADSSSIWASELDINENGTLSFCLFAKGSKHYTGKRHTTDSYEVAAVRSAHGTLQVRYRVRMVVRLGGKRVRGTFTLADRSANTYPVLIGCRLLTGKFVVDVSRGIKYAGSRGEPKFNNELRKNPHAFFEKYHKNNQRGDI